MSDAANRDQAENWNQASGPVWVEMQPLLDRMLEPLLPGLLEDAFPGAGGRVLDVGCGAGATTLAMAERLGPDGLCLGVDISAPLVAHARRRAAGGGCAAAAFIEADAQTHAFKPEEFDAVMSRFGVMFFDDPEAAFANLRRATRRGGKLAFVAWRSPAENPFMIAGPLAAAPLLPSLAPPPPDAPGQFAFADVERVRRILHAAGWRDVEVLPLDVPSAVPEADLAVYATKLGPVGAALRTADEATREKVAAALKGAYAPFVREGAARFTAACWRVRARA